MTKPAAAAFAFVRSSMSAAVLSWLPCCAAACVSASARAVAAAASFALAPSSCARRAAGAPEVWKPYRTPSVPQAAASVAFPVLGIRARVYNVQGC